LIAQALHIGERRAEHLVIVTTIEHAGEHAGRQTQALKSLRRPLPLASHHTETHDADDPLCQRQWHDHGRLEVEAKQACAVDPVGQLVGTGEAHQLAGQELREHPGKALLGRDARGRRWNLRTPPTVRAEQIAIITALEQRASVKIERFHDAALRLVDGGVDVGSGADRFAPPTHMRFRNVPLGARSSRGH
jgi:hypothetical protein